MNFIEAKLKGAFIIELVKIEDTRGFFARSFCMREFEAHGIEANFVQCNISFNKKRGTLRGMHHQVAPHEESKLVRCTMGAVYDVIIDLRPNSETFKQWISVELTCENGRMVYIPKGCSHGFLTLKDNTEVFYHMSEFYAPEYSRGVRWNDPAFAIQWPTEVRCLSKRDQQFPDFAA